MKVLLDENFPLDLVPEFVGHECYHVVTLGWQGTLNGELLCRAETEGIEVLVTFDKGIPRDHDIAARQIAVYVVQPHGQGPTATRALLGQILKALETCHPGQALIVTNRPGRTT